VAVKKKLAILVLVENMMTPHARLDTLLAERFPPIEEPESMVTRWKAAFFLTAAALALLLLLSTMAHGGAGWVE